MKLRAAVYVRLGEGQRPPRSFRGAARSSESDAAMQNQFLPESSTETTYAPPVLAPVELAAIEKEDAQTTQTVPHWLAKIQRKAQRDKTNFWRVYIFLQLFFFVPLLLTGAFPVMRNGHFNLPVLLMLFTPAIGMALMTLRFAFKKPNWNAEEVARVGGVQAVGTLIDLLQVPKAPRQMTPLYAALTDILPRMKASDAGMLTSAQRKTLHLTLRSESSFSVNPAVVFRYRLAVLKALEQIGDASALPLVTRLAKGRARTANQKAIKTAAQDCLPLLTANSGGLEANKTLLRASSPEETGKETLLRPAAFAPDPNPNQLLRASDSPALPPVAP